MINRRKMFKKRVSVQPLEVGQPDIDRENDVGKTVNHAF